MTTKKPVRTDAVKARLATADALRILVKLQASTAMYLKKNA